MNICVNLQNKVSTISVDKFQKTLGKCKMPTVESACGVHLPELEVTGLDKLVKILPECLKGNTTLLFLSTRSETHSFLDDIDKMWTGEFGGNDKYSTFFVSLVLDPIWASPVLGRYMREGAKREIVKSRWSTTTTAVMTESEVNEFLKSVKIPSSYRIGSTTLKTLDHPVILLVDSKGVIQYCIIGHNHHDMAEMRAEFMRLIEKAKGLTQKTRMFDGKVEESAGIGSTA